MLLRNYPVRPDFAIYDAEALKFRLGSVFFILDSYFTFMGEFQVFDSMKYSLLLGFGEKESTREANKTWREPQQLTNRLMVDDLFLVERDRFLEDLKQRDEEQYFLYELEGKTVYQKLKLWAEYYEKN